MQKEPKSHTTTNKIKTIMEHSWRAKKELPIMGIKDKNGGDLSRSGIDAFVCKISKFWFKTERFYTRERDGIIYVGVADAEN
jgi:hypothetical protein